MVVSGFPPKCYKTHSCNGWQRKRGRREAREGGEGGVHRCRQNVIKRTRATAGREGERGREGGEGGRRVPSQVKCRHVRLSYLYIAKLYTVRHIVLLNTGRNTTEKDKK